MRPGVQEIKHSIFYVMIFNFVNLFQQSSSRKEK